MKNRIFGRASATLAACSSLLLLTPGLALADTPDVVGKKYGEARELLSAAGMTPVVGTVVGDRVQQDQCYVVSASKRTSRDASGNPSDNKVQVHLSCYGRPANGVTPGMSKGNNAKDALAIRAAQDEETKKWKQTVVGQEWCAEAEAEHPDWAPIEGCHPGS